MKDIPKSHLVLLVLVISTILWSGIGVVDTYLTWVLEAAPALVGLLVLLLTYNKFRMPTYLYALMAFHMAVLLVGAHYSYAKVPLGFWMEDWFGFTRNNYDKIGHFMQGFTPYLACRQLLAVRGVKQTGFFPIFLAVSVSLAVSALYELIEYSTCVFSVDGADDFVGSQGDPFDTQTDMLGAFIGALAAVFIFLKFRWKTNLNSCDETGC